MYLCCIFLDKGHWFLVSFQIQTVCFDNLGLLLAAALNILFKNNERCALNLLVLCSFYLIISYTISNGTPIFGLMTLELNRWFREPGHIIKDEKGIELGERREGSLFLILFDFYMQSFLSLTEFRGTVSNNFVKFVRLQACLPFVVYPIFSAIDLFGIYQGLKHVHLQTLSKVCQAPDNFSSHWDG